MKFRQWRCFNYDKKISLNFVPKGPTDNKPSLVQVMAWNRIGDKPLHEPMMTQFNWRIYMRRPAFMSSLVGPWEMWPIQRQAIIWTNVGL